MRNLTARLALHSAGILILANGFRLLFAPSKITDYMHTQRGGHWQFLTIIGGALHCYQLSIVLRYYCSELSRAPDEYSLIFDYDAFLPASFLPRCNDRVASSGCVSK